MGSIKEKEKSSVIDGTIKEKKYWIKPGIEVVHRENPNRKMLVDKIVRESKVIKNGIEDRRKVFVIGVECHWMNDSGDYVKGRFFTNELLPWKDKKESESVSTDEPKKANGSSGA